MEMAKINFLILFAFIFICCGKSSKTVTPTAGPPPPSQVGDQNNATGHWLCNKDKYCVIKPHADITTVKEYLGSYIVGCADSGICYANPPAEYLSECAEPEHIRFIASGFFNRLYQTQDLCPLDVAHIISTDPCNNNPQYQLPTEGDCKATGTCIWLHCYWQ